MVFDNLKRVDSELQPNYHFYFIVPPTKIEIAGVQPGSRMTIRENEAVELRCVVHDAKPKATIVWFRENTEFITGKID